MVLNVSSKILGRAPERYRVSLALRGVPLQARREIALALELGDIGPSPSIAALEADFARAMGVPYAVAASSGTMAVALCVAALALECGGREVIIPAASFPAQANAVRMAGLTPVPVDHDPERPFNLSPASAKAALCEDTAAIMPANLMGFPDAVADLNWGIPLLADACEALDGATGAQPEYVAAAYSFFVTHVIPAGEGGIAITRNEALARLMGSLRDHGRISPISQATLPIGFNAKMTGLASIIARAHFPRLAEYVGRRRHIYRHYYARLGGFPLPSHCCPHAFPVIFEGRSQRDQALERLLEAGVEARPWFPCASEGAPVAKRLSDTVLYVPCHQEMNPEDADYVAGVLENCPGRRESWL